MKKVIIISIFIAIICLPVVTKATTDTQALIESLKQQIETLRAQVLELQNQLIDIKEGKKEIKETTKEIKSILKIARQLDWGASGEDVTLLQEVLASDPEIYPEGLVTGYFGPLTYKAVKNFQKKMGVEQVGRVGPKTMSKINELLKEGAGSSGKVPPGLLVAPGIRKKIGQSPEIPFGQKLPPGIAKKLDGATSTEPVDDDDATSTPDIIAPVISNLTSSAATTTADISWTTDEPADSKVWYSTTTPLVISEAPWFMSSSDLVTNHHLSLLNLTASTTYYFIIASADEADNLATSTESSLTTLAEEIQEPVDTTAPILTDITATSTTATSTRINWNTNEEADSKVWYDIVTPLVVSTSTLSVNSSVLTTYHNLLISNLAASTTHYYLVTSADNQGNQATSTEGMFTTFSE